MSEERPEQIDDERLVEVYRASDAAEAHLLSDVLSDSGIPNRIEGEALQSIIGEIPIGWMSAPRIMVLEHHASDARAIIERLEQSRRKK